MLFMAAKVNCFSNNAISHNAQLKFTGENNQIDTASYWHSIAFTLMIIFRTDTDCIISAKLHSEHAGYIQKQTIECWNVILRYVNDSRPWIIVPRGLKRGRVAGETCRQKLSG